MTYISLSFIISCALSFLMISCTGIDIPGEENLTVDFPVNLKADMGVGTRISLDDLSITWEEEDMLKIVAVSADETYAISELEIYQINPDDQSMASFSGFVTMLSQPGDCYFLYPNSAATSYNASTGRINFQYSAQSGRHEPMMYAKTSYNTDGMTAGLKYAGAILQLDVQIPDVSTITFTGNKLENIYPIEIDPDTDEVFFSNERGVQITVPVQTTGYTYICVPPVKLENGFSLICSKTDGSYQVKSFSSDGSLSGGYDFSEKVGALIPITLSGEFESFNISASALSGQHTKNGNLLTGTQVKFTMNKSGSSNKLIEEWGANLLNTEGKVVRTISFSNTTPIVGQSVSMNVANNWKLLPAGQYVFTPYYKMYGQTKTLPSQILTLEDPGVTVSVVGSTSYDKYMAGNVTGANSHTNTLIEGVSVVTNLDLSIIDSRDVTLDNSSIGSGTWSSGTMSFGNITKTTFKAYECKASIMVGNLKFEVSKTFNITGLPYEINFANGDNSSWAKLGGAKYSSKRIEFESSFTTGKDGAIVSPKFYIPNSVNVSTAVDACGRHTQTDNRKVYLSRSKNNSNITKGSDTVTGEYKISYSSSGYINSSATFNLTSEYPYMMYAASPKLYSLVLYRVKIEYKQKIN